MKDAEDVNWKIILMHYAAHNVEDVQMFVRQISPVKNFSPRKLMMDLRARMNEKAPFKTY